MGNYVRTGTFFSLSFFVFYLTRDVVLFCNQLEWLTALPWVPPPASSGALTRFDLRSKFKLRTQSRKTMRTTLVSTRLSDG